MKNNVLTSMMVAVILVPVLAHGISCPSSGKPGIWSANATYLCSRWDGTRFVRDIRVLSPDHRKAVHVVTDSWFVEVGGKRLRLSAEEAYVSYYPAELEWAPDSTAFYITQSDATSEINGFHTEIYRVDEQNLSRMQDIGPMVRDRFIQRHRCVEGDYNVAGFKWLNGSSQIVVLAELPSDSKCAPREYFVGYVIAIDEMHLVREYNPQELFRRWRPLLGVRVRADYDNLSSVDRAGKP